MPGPNQAEQTGVWKGLDCWLVYHWLRVYPLTNQRGFICQLKHLLVGLFNHIQPISKVRAWFWKLNYSQTNVQKCSKPTTTVVVSQSFLSFISPWLTTGPNNSVVLSTVLQHQLGDLVLHRLLQGDLFALRQLTLDVGHWYRASACELNMTSDLFNDLHGFALLFLQQVHDYVQVSGIPGTIWSHVHGILIITRIWNLKLVFGRNKPRFFAKSKKVAKFHIFVHLGGATQLLRRPQHGYIL